jgi:undecaprenyl-diphosphatase
MTTLHALILGIIEGLTEFLPISSTAHVLLVSKLLGIVQSPVTQTFDICVQIGSILAVVVLYFKKFFNWELLAKLVVAFIPTGVAGLVLYPHLKSFFANDWLIVGTLFFGGIIILVIESWYGKKFYSSEKTLHSISYMHAFILGCFQALAIVPGTSRSGATIVGGLFLGINRAVLIEFTFLLAVPTMAVATLYTIYKNHADLVTSNAVTPLLLGTVVAFIVALFVIKKFLAYVRTKPFTIFGWYRIVLACVVAIILLA